MPYRTEIWPGGAHTHSVRGAPDVFQEPKRALADGILMTPSLVKIEPPPVVGKMVGTLSNTNVLLDALGLKISDR